MLRHALLTVSVIGLLLAAGCASNPRPVTPTGGASAPGSSASSAVPTSSSDCEYVASDNPAKPVELPEGTDVERTGTVTVTLTTNEGPVRITMDRAAAPCTVNSFVSLVEQQYYDATTCHRLSDSGIFILQCGDPTATGSGGPGYTFADEVSPDTTYPAGTVAMANSGPDTNGSQFFLVYTDTDLPPSYTAFGTMDAESLGIVNRISAEGQDGSNPDGTGKPNNPAEIVTATVG